MCLIYTKIKTHIPWKRYENASEVSKEFHKISYLLMPKGVNRYENGPGAHVYAVLSRYAVAIEHVWLWQTPMNRHAGTLLSVGGVIRFLRL